LGVTTNIRSAVLPNVPTFEEQGLKDFDVTVFFGVVAPKGTPPGVIAKLNGAVSDLLKEPVVKAVLSEQGIIPAPSIDPEFFATCMADEIAKWRAVVKSVGAEIK
jgi:tripartite-type tricarboxylate transporter receptor subunit TctC